VKLTVLSIMLLGNACEEEIPDLIQYDLVPTAGSVEFLQEWALYTRNNWQHCQITCDDKVSDECFSLQCIHYNLILKP